jgi:hypothetical protein
MKCRKEKREITEEHLRDQKKRALAYGMMISINHRLLESAMWSRALCGDRNVDPGIAVKAEDATNMSLEATEG